METGSTWRLSRTRLCRFPFDPPVVVESLLFVEDRDLLDPRRNPAVEWSRFTLAVAGRAVSLLDRRFGEGGASTLATQTEKFRHSPGGRTPGVGEKFRQMVTASARAYRDGPDTRAARRQIVTAYLNSEPLARIRVLLERNAFDDILHDRQRQGYPFGHLVPSFGSAIGSSGDRPDALADLMGIILNNGMRLPTVDLQRQEFAAGPPYATDMAIKPEPKRVLAPEVAETVRRALLGVVVKARPRGYAAPTAPRTEARCPSAVRPVPATTASTASAPRTDAPPPAISLIEPMPTWFRKPANIETEGVAGSSD
jgi:membrane peptidoglycan carboxypeptidase